MDSSFDLSSVPDQAIFDEFTRRVKCSKLPEQKIILFGPPGSGKGTQGSRLTHELCSCHISTGDLLRNEIRGGTELGNKAKDIMSAGGLVPDEVVIEILKKKIESPECKRGAVLDGFPRTFEQAKKLDDMLIQQGSKIDKVLNFQVNEQQLLERLAGRRIHEPSGRTYHLKYNPPKNEGRDDLTGEPLIQRPDDKPETIKNRLDTYNNKTKAVLEYYSGRGILNNLNANRTIDSVWNDISKLVTRDLE